MRFPRYLASVLLLSSIAALAEETPVRGSLCIMGEPKNACVSTTASSVNVDVRDQNRAYVWSFPPQHRSIVGILEAGQSAVGAGVDSGTVRFRIAGQKSRGWPDAVTLTLKAAEQVWTWKLAAADVENPQVIEAPPGTYSLILAAPHHCDVIYPKLVSQARKTTSLGTLVLLPTKRILGRVVTTAGEAVEAAEIAAADDRPISRTDAKGRFVLEFKGRGPSFVVVRHHEYAPRTVSLEGAALDAVLPPVVLERGVSVVLEIDRSKLERPVDVDVELYRDTGLNQQLRLAGVAHVQSKEGRARFGRVETGSYVVVVKGPTVLQQLAKPLEIGPEKLQHEFIDIDPVKLTLEVRRGGAVLPDAQVRLTCVGPARSAWNPVLRTDASGNIEGELWHGGTLQASVFAPGAAEPIDAHREIASSDIVWRIDIPARSVVATVREGESGAAVPHAVVTHVTGGNETNGGSPWRTLTDATGRTRFEGLAAGAHLFRVEAPGFLDPEPQVVTLDADEEERTVEFKLAKGKQVTVHINDWAAAPLTGATVLDGFDEGGMNPARFLKSDESGDVVVPFDDDRPKTLFVIPENASFAIAEVSPAAGLTASVNVPPPEATLHIEAVYKDGMSAGRLLYLLRYNGRFVPPAATRIKAYQQEGTRRQYGPDGSLQLNFLPRGHYEIWPATNERELAMLQRAPTPPAATIDLSSGDFNVRLVIAPRTPPTE